MIEVVFPDFVVSAEHLQTFLMLLAAYHWSAKTFCHLSKTFRLSKLQLFTEMKIEIEPIAQMDIFLQLV